MSADDPTAAADTNADTSGGGVPAAVRQYLEEEAVARVVAALDALEETTGSTAAADDVSSPRQLSATRLELRASLPAARMFESLCRSRGQKTWQQTKRLVHQPQLESLAALLDARGLLRTQTSEQLASGAPARRALARSVEPIESERRVNVRCPSLRCSHLNWHPTGLPPLLFLTARPLMFAGCSRREPAGRLWRVPPAA